MMTRTMPHPRLAFTLSLALLAACGQTPVPAPPADPAPQAAATAAPQDERAGMGGAGPVEPDRFHPDRQPGADGKRPPMPDPVRGGRLIVHISTLPKNINYMIENSGVTRRILYEAHEFLIQRDWETWEHKPRLATGWDTEDTLVLTAAGAAAHKASIVREFDPDKKPVLYGKVTEEADGYLVTPLSVKNPLTAPERVAKAEVESLEQGTVFTFHLRPNVRWQDGHVLDTGDIVFSYRQYLNPAVDCDSVRFTFEKFGACEAIDLQTVRFFYLKRYFGAVDAFTGFTILPSHLYNLADKDNPKKKPNATPAEQGKFINEHPNNNLWVGLGPYQVTEFTNQAVEAKRWDGYYNPDEGGYVDTIRWRYIPGDDAATQAVVNGEVDFFDRIKTDDYFGELTAKPEFLAKNYKGYYYTPRMGYMAWNMRRPLFAEKSVRQALQYAFDWDEMLRTVYHSLGVRVTGISFYLSGDYNHDVQPIKIDVEKSKQMLAEAGWYDRNNDGIIDKDGKPFEFEFMMPTGNKASETQGLKLQESLGKVGVKVNIATREWATFLERIQTEDFDCVNLAWILEVESDPEQIWHSKWANKRGANHAGVADPKVDEMVTLYQQELDLEKRQKISRDLHAYLYDLQPYLFGLSVPNKFAISRRVRNFQAFVIDPGYSLRRWWLSDGGVAPGAAPPSPAR